MCVTVLTDLLRRYKNKHILNFLSILIYTLSTMKRPSVNGNGKVMSLREFQSLYDEKKLPPAPVASKVLSAADMSRRLGMISPSLLDAGSLSSDDSSYEEESQSSSEDDEGIFVDLKLVVGESEEGKKPGEGWASKPLSKRPRGDCCDSIVSGCCNTMRGGTAAALKAQVYGMY